MECKASSTAFRGDLGQVLIETLWNVKVVVAASADCGDRVLIETLWNVKKDAELVILGTGTVLIETLWNVKADQSTDSGD